MPSKSTSQSSSHRMRWFIKNKRDSKVDWTKRRRRKGTNQTTLKRYRLQLPLVWYSLMYFLIFLCFLVLLSESIQLQQQVNPGLDISLYDKNDLNQFQRYVSLTRFLNEKSMLDIWTECQNKLSQNYGKNWRCLDAQSDTISKMNGTFTWDRHTINGGKDSSTKLLVPDCQLNSRFRGTFGSANRSTSRCFAYSLWV